MYEKNSFKISCKRSETFKLLGLVVSNVLLRWKSDEELALGFEILLLGPLLWLSGNEGEIPLEAELFSMEFHLVTQ